MSCDTIDKEKSCSNSAAYLNRLMRDFLKCGTVMHFFRISSSLSAIAVNADRTGAILFLVMRPGKKILEQIIRSTRSAKPLRTAERRSEPVFAPAEWIATRQRPVAN
jgi:hypothetical protein